MSKPSRKRKNQHYPHESRAVPHSSTWFEETLQHNPMAALITGMVVSQSGRTDGCSVCGDTPAPIYDAADAPHQCLRLCDDCLGIRAAMYDEHYRLRSQSE